jgi:hypothetical protein
MMREYNLGLKPENILKFKDGKVYKNDQKGLDELILKLIRKPFDLSNDSMLRAELIKLDKDEFTLVVTMHHIASDAWSISILVKEVAELYNSYLEKRYADLSDLEIQYADYAIWQRNYLQGEVLEKKLEYWKEKLDGVKPIELPAPDALPYADGGFETSSGKVELFSAEMEAEGLDPGLRLSVIL